MGLGLILRICFDERTYLMSNNKWTVESAIAHVKRNGGKVYTKGKHIYMARPGLGVLGAIDYLSSRGWKWFQTYKGS